MNQREYENELRIKLVGRKIVAIRYFSTAESDAMGWSYQPLDLHLDDSTALFAMSDDEGNEAGALSLEDFHHQTSETIGVRRNEVRQ